MSEHAGNCGYVLHGGACDCGLREQSAVMFKHQERIRELEAALTRILGTANEPWQEVNLETQMANIATIAADALNPPFPWWRCSEYLVGPGI